jgi:hypothetical protein
MIRETQPPRHRHCARPGGHGRAWLIAAVLVTIAAPAAAQEERTSAPSLPEPTADDPPAPMDKTEVLEERIAELSERLRQSEEKKLVASPLTWNGYIDFGFFAPDPLAEGNGNGGVGWVRDDAHTQFPQFSNYAWVFLGDILGTPVNTRGEVPDLGDAPGLTTPRYDGINSDGAASFILNEINLRPRYQLSDNAIMRASLNFAPRTGSDFALGDTVDADLAELEYLITKDGKTSIFAGKVLPVFGIEYKEKKSDQRFGITPSLISRYTIGAQLGLKIRSKLLDDWLVLAGSVTNGSSTIEMFHFYNETDRNNFKTLNGRAAVSAPIGKLYRSDDRLELGLSGEWGTPDRATNDSRKMWFAGADVQFLGVGYALKAQVMKGKSPGLFDQGVWELDLNWSGYAEVNWLPLAYLGLIVRAELRDALVSLGMDRLYVTKQARFTGGVRVIVNPHMVVKAEYLHNEEYGGIAGIDNDVATSSMVLAF